MATNSSTLALAAALVLSTMMMIGAVQAAPLSPAPSPAVSNCSTVLTEAADCDPYIIPGSIQAAPTEQCCSELRAMTNSSAAFCLCDFLLLAGSSGAPVDADRVASLPTACGFRLSPAIAFRNPNLICIAVDPNASGASGVRGTFTMGLLFGGMMAAAAVL